MSKTPSDILSDAFNRFHREATLAFTKAQEQATADARQARRERDDAVNALHASRLEEQAWKQEAGVWKATADQAELTINHHLETIAQLRQQADQWKDQCLRLEETSRQEAVSWKEQFLRVEQERSKLAQRVDELVVEQRSAGGRATAPFTPRYSAMGDASARLQRESALDSLSPRLQEHPPSKSALSASKAPSNANRTRVPPAVQLPTPSSENQRSARQRIAQEAAQAGPSTSSNGTRQVLVRRVHTVVEVPVKEESVGPEGLGQAAIPTSSGASHVASTSTLATAASTSKMSNVPPRPAQMVKATPRVKRKAAPKRSYVEIDDDESERDGSEAGDAQDGAVSDDDELMMGVETNRKEVYGMKRVVKPSPVQKTVRPLSVVKQRKAPPPAKRSRPATVSKA